MLEGLVAQLVGRVELLEADVHFGKTKCDEGSHTMIVVVREGVLQLADVGEPLDGVYFACMHCDRLWGTLPVVEEEVDREALAEARGGLDG